MGDSKTAMISIRCFHHLDPVEPDWRKLVSLGAASQVFYTPGWARAWYRSLGSGEMRVFKVEEADRVIGLLPALRCSSAMTLLGDKEVCDYLDVLALPGNESQVVEALLEASEGQGDSLDLYPLRPDSVLWRQLPALAESHGYHLEKETLDVSFALELPATWEGYFQLLKKKDRHELRRKFRNLYSAGEVRFCSGRPTDEGMDHFFHLFRLSREDKQAFLTPEREAFFREMAAELGNQGWAELGFLELDQKRVAAAFCLDYGDTISLYNSGYDPDYAPLSVGLLCKAMTIKNAIEKGRKIYDFLRGAEDYKFHLGGRPFPVYRAVVSHSGGDLK